MEVDGESSVRGMELITRSEGRGCWFGSRGGGGCEVLSEGGLIAGEADCEFWSHALRAS